MGQSFFGFHDVSNGHQPDIAIPPTKYLDHFCMLADPKRCYTYSQLSSNDKLFRANAARHFENSRIWCIKNEEAYTEFLDAASDPSYNRQHPNTSAASVHFACGQTGHLKKVCTATVSRPQSFIGASEFSSRRPRARRGG